MIFKINKMIKKDYSKSNNKSTLKIIKNILDLMARKNKLSLILLLIIIIINGITEVTSISTTIPVVNLILNEETFQKSSWGKVLSSIFIEYDLNQLKIVTIVIFISLIISTTLLRVFNIYISSKIVSRIGYDLGKEMIENSLRIPYEDQIRSKSSDLIARQTYYIDQTNRAISDFVIAFGNSLISFFIFGYLLYLNFLTCVSALITFTFIYYLFSKSSKKKLQRNSYRNITLKQKQIQYIQECLGSIREIILDNSYSDHIDQHSRMDKEIWDIKHQNAVIRQSPRFIVEGAGIIFIVVAGVIIKFSGVYSTSEEVIATLAGFSLASQKLLPSLQRIYTSWTSFQTRKDSINRTINYIIQKRKRNKEKLQINSEGIDKKYKKQIDFEEIKILNASYSYLDNNNYVLNEISLSIRSGEKIGIIGKTGSGKSTIIDLILGLIKPKRGKIYLNSKELYINEELILDWRMIIAHVPQTIFLKDSTILDNIIYNTSEINYDSDRVQQAIKNAQLEDFINSLPKGINTLVGERGSLLSGGQRQRIGIARALYKNSSLIVLDEATNALDKETEQKVIKSICSNKKLTALIISHDNSVLKECDYLLKIDNGKIERILN